MGKDSKGNELPKNKYCSDVEDLGEALATNTFLLACSVEMKKGNTVVYNKKYKMATMTDKDGFQTFLSH